MSRPRIHPIGFQKEYNAWINMHLRCYKELDKVYYRYGGRGIAVCKRWHEFINFIDDMGKSPKGYSLERINNDKHYNKKNCKWATQAEQCNNRSTNVRIAFNGTTKNLGQWAKLLGISQRAVSRRHRKGLPLTVHAGTKNLPTGGRDGEEDQT